jgi:hypothetical protein
MVAAAAAAVAAAAVEGGGGMDAKHVEMQLQEKGCSCVVS